MIELKNRQTCAVLLSTYNGQEYLREQLDSIFSQRDVDVTLFVRDDGSTDLTMKIVKEYKDNHDIVIIEDDNNVGPGKSFYILLQKACKCEREFDYFAFSDQDDIWLEDKIISGINSEHSDDELFMYCSNQYIFKNGVNEGVRHIEDPDMTLIGHLYKNYISGCTFILNRALAIEIIRGGAPSDTILKHRIHDAWIIFIAIGIGRVFYDSRPHILYRIHENNTVGLDYKKSFTKKLKDFMAGDGKGYISNQAVFALKNYVFKETQELEYIKHVANYKKSLQSKKFLLKNGEAIKYTKVSRIKYIFRILLNYF